jgi:hypothetical protein
MRRLCSALTLLVPLVVASQSWAADVPISDEARTHFQSGVNLLKDPDGARYEEAYREFRAAYSASPSYKILGNLGLCALKLERDGEAIEAYETYLKHASELDPSEVMQVRTDLSTLKTGLVQVTLKVTPPGATVTDTRTPTRGDRVSNVYDASGGTLKVAIRAGHHQVAVRLSDYQETTWEFDAPPGATLNKEITLRKVTPDTVQVVTPPVVTHLPPSRPLPTGFWIGVATTGALTAGATVVGILALKNGADYKDANNGRHVDLATSLHDDTNKLNIASDVLIVGAALAAGFTVYEYLARPTVPATNEKQAHVRVIPMVSDKGGLLSLSGTWF